MNHSKYIEKILSKFGMMDCKLHSTSHEMNIMKPSDEVDLIDSKPHCEIIGSLYIYIYIMVATRPDISYTVTSLSQDLTKPDSFHLTKAKHILHYLKGMFDCLRESHEIFIDLPVNSSRRSANQR